MDFMQGHRSMMAAMQRDAESMQRRMMHDMSHMREEMQANAARMRQEAEQQMQQVRQASLARGEEMRRSMQVRAQEQHNMQRDLMSTHRQMMQEHSRQMRDHHRQAMNMSMNQFGSSSPSSGYDSFMQVQTGGGAGSTSVEVRDGCVYVNGQRVANMPNGGNVSVVNGVVQINGQRIRTDNPPAQAPEPHRRRREGGPDFHRGGGGESLQATCDRVSVAGTAVKDMEEPCPICLDEVCKDQATRTFECMHMLHRHCAEALVQDSASRRSALHCPVCRHQLQF
eukprot:TRINITY_DN36516_c0_g1_i1.p1 TRINITY_DN36516_c0_g1~~TRINITY_DN36516_c0_g1_i1.p1  ORF type:complete len:282 (+),score=63.91 TRINITY_DN36516_c0_g1_i1:142-987(+)